MDQSNKKQVLVVDDAETNIAILIELLGDFYDVSIALNGPDALEIVMNNQPDLILLDIVMPGMDGFQVCTQLKKNEKTKSIPVIFLTGETTEESVVQGFALGAADFLTKPFLPAELLARVQTHLTLAEVQEKEKAYIDQIKGFNQRLSEKVWAQGQELKVTYEQLALLDRSKDEFLTLISHELRTPMNGILGPITLLFTGDRELTEDETWIKETFFTSYDRLIGVVDEALLLTQIKLDGQEMPIKQVSLQQVIAKVKTAHQKSAAKFDLEILGERDALVTGSASLYVKALSALVETAGKFSDFQTPVQIHIGQGSESPSIKIISQGYHIPEKLLPDLFKIYSISNPLTPNGDLGLKPPIADKIIRLYGGHLVAKNFTEPGIEFDVFFPG